MGEHDFLFHKHEIVNVFQAISARQREQVTAMWLRNRAVSGLHEAQRRVNEVVYIIHDGQQVVGASSVYPGILGQDSIIYYFYRMFIQPGSRVFGMMTYVTVKTRDFLQGLKVDNKPAGMIIVSENKKLARPASRKRIRDTLRFEYLGIGPKGNDVWRYRF